MTLIEVVDDRESQAQVGLLERPGRLPEYLYMAEQKGSGKVNYAGRIKVVT